METKKLSFAMAMKHYFKVKAGQTLADFVKELKALTDADRADFKKELEKVGYEIT